MHLCPGRPYNHQPARRSAPAALDNFTVFEGTSAIQRLIIGRWITELDVR
jgi:hypothetical protein